MKPRLFKEFGVWVCWGGLFYRQAVCPKEAYKLWLETYNKAALFAGCPEKVISA